MKIDQILLLNQVYKFNINQFAPLFSNKETVILYYPELGVKNNGKFFVNRIRKKGIINEVLILPFYNLINRKLPAQSYIKEFRELNPNIKVVTQFKTFVKGKVNLIDLTLLSELYFLQTRNLSKFKVTQEIINIFNQFIDEYKKENREFYLIIDAGRNEIDNIFSEMLFKMARKNGFKFDQDFLKINGGIINKFIEDEQEFQWYPILYKKEKELIFKFNTFMLFQKSYQTGFKDEEEIENLESINEKGEVDLEKKYENIRKQVIDITEKFSDKKINIENLLNTGETEDALDSVYELLNDKDIEGDTVQEKLENLFKNEKDSKIKEKIKKLIEYLNEINNQFNGAIKLNYKLINETSNSYFDHKRIIKLDELTGYKKHENEFDKILDHAMFDLIKSIEKDEEAGVKVLNIKTEIYDTNKSRFKKYIITMKNTDTENKSPYTQEIIVPYPIKGKYFKIDGVNYIMINQFFPKPLLKVKPNMVRLYTHFSTFTVWLTTHIINETQDIDEFINILLKLNKHAKLNFIEKDKLDKIVDEFDLKDVNLDLISKKLEF